MFNSQKNVKKITLIAILLIIALISFFVLAKIASSPKVHESTINSLSDKRTTVMELTAATAATSIALSAVPGDATTPIANKIADFSSYLIIIFCAIELEKILITVLGYFSFKFIIPLACILYGIYIFSKNNFLKSISIKLCIFGIIITAIIPIGIRVGDIIYDTHKASIEQTIQNAEEANAEISANTDIADEKETGFFNVFSKINNSISDFAKKGEETLENFIEAIVVLIITSCLIPIAVIFLVVWLTKIIFGININTSKLKKLQSRDN